MRRFAMLLVVMAVPAVCFAYLGIPRIGGLNTTNAAEGLPTAVYANPAAMGLIAGNELFFDLAATYFMASFDREGENPDTGDPYGECGFGTFIPVPFLGAVFNSGLDWLKLGAAFYVPFGRIAHWPEDGPQRYQLTDLEEIDLVLSGAVAVRLFRGLWLGGAIEPRYLIFNFGRSLDLADFAPDLSEDLLGTRIPEEMFPPEQSEWEGRLSVEAGDFSYGWSVGILAVPIHWLKLGATYHAPVHFEPEGDFELTVPDEPLRLFGLLSFEGGVRQMLEDMVGVNAPSRLRGEAKFEFDFPQSVVFGMQVGPIKKWRFLTSVAWVDWSAYDVIKANLKPENSELELPEDEVHVGNEPSWIFGFVVAREHRQKDLWGFGVNYETDSIPERYASAFNVNATQLDFMGFYRWQFSPKMALGFGASYLYWFPKEVGETEVDRAESAKGLYEANVFRLGVNFDLAF